LTEKEYAGTFLNFYRTTTNEMLKTKIAPPTDTQPVIEKSKSVPPALLIGGGILLTPVVLLMLGGIAADHLGRSQPTADRPTPAPVSITEQPAPPKAQPSELSRSVISQPIDKTPEKAEAKISPQIATPTITSQASESKFNAAIFDPPSNCRTAPGTENTVAQVLPKGDVWVDRQAPQSDRKGEAWYQEKYLGCWLHHSQLRFPDQSPPMEPTQVQPPSQVETVQPPSQVETATVRESASGYVPGTCKALRRMGLSRFTPGDPNYTSARDRDHDGIACE
jgi:Excalibur calcium-binding domain